MKMNPQSYDEDEVVVTCAVCGFKNARRFMNVFERGNNIYGLATGTILCATCLGQHEKWMVTNGFWTGNVKTTQPQIIHAIGLKAHWENIFKNS